MEGNAHLLQLIRNMRSQINRLEKENRTLKGELQGCGRKAGPAGDGNGGARSLAFAAEGAAASPAFPQGRAAASPAAAPSEQPDTAMTVRRYSTVSPAPALSVTKSHWAGRKPPSNGLPEVPGSAQPPASPPAAQLNKEEEKGLEKPPASCLSYSHSSNTNLFQEHVHKCQGKVKTVSFLLPMDMSSFAKKQGSLKSPQNQSTKHLMTITEKGM